MKMEGISEMSLANINHVYLDELTAEIADAEKQQMRLMDYIVGLRALHDGIKIFLEKKNGLADSNADPLFNSINFLDKLKLTTISSPNETIFGSTLSADVPANRLEEVCNDTSHLPEIALADNHSASLENELSNKEILKGLPLFEALKKYLSMFSEKQTVKVIIDGLTDYGFEADVKHLYEGVRGMLRYYEKKGIFERDGAAWGLVKETRTEVGAKSQFEEQTVSQIETPNKSGASIEFPTERIIMENKPPNATVKTNTEYCKEILQKSGQPWLHVDQILVCLQKDYGIVRSKKIISSALRKNANNKRRVFKSFGRNRFGLLEEQPTVAENISN